MRDMGYGVHCAMCTYERSGLTQGQAQTDKLNHETQTGHTVAVARELDERDESDDH